MQMNQKMSRNTVECQLLYKLGEHYCIVQLSLNAPDSIYCNTCSLQILHEHPGGRCIVNVAFLKFSMCSMAQNTFFIFFPLAFCMFLYSLEN